MDRIFISKMHPYGNSGAMNLLTMLPAAGALNTASSHHRTARTLRTPLLLHPEAQDLGEERVAPIFAAVNKTYFWL